MGVVTGEGTVFKYRTVGSVRIGDPDFVGRELER